MWIARLSIENIYTKLEVVKLNKKTIYSRNYFDYLLPMKMLTLLKLKPTHLFSVPYELSTFRVCANIRDCRRLLAHFLRSSPGQSSCCCLFAGNFYLMSPMSLTKHVEFVSDISSPSCNQTIVNKSQNRPDDVVMS